MIALDIGGTKTSIFFSTRRNFLSFKREWKERILETNEKQKYCIIPTFFRESKKNFSMLFSFLKSLDEEVISTFPGIVRMERKGGKWKFRVFSKKLPFLTGKCMNVNFAVNDVYAFAYYHARKFFKNPANRGKTILSIQIGTGVNAVHMNYYDYEQLLFLKKIFEAGHVTMRQGKERCFCGRRGCAELYVSGKFLEKLGNGNPAAVFKDASLKREYYANLSLYVSSLVILFSPDKIVLGGGVAKSLEPELLHKFVEESFPHFRIPLHIEYEVDPSPLSNLKGLVYLYNRFRKTSHLLRNFPF